LYEISEETTIGAAILSLCLFYTAGVCGRTGVHGAVTSAVVQEPEHELDRAQTLHPQMAVTIVRGRHKKRQSAH